MSEAKKDIQPRLWKTTAHMLGFGLLLALMLLLAKGPPGDAQDGSRVSFTEADLAHVHAAFERTWSRPPTAVELRKAFGRYVRDEVLYREALARQLDRNDPVVKMSLVRKITMLGTAAAQATEPTDAEVQAYFELRGERYRIPASFDLMQVYVSPDKHGDQTGTVAAQLLTQLSEKDPGPEEAVQLGDMSMLPPVGKDMSEDEVARTFGTEFKDAIMSLAIGKWEGPIESGFGLHFVKITHREESRIPSWTEVRDRIVTDMKFEGSKAAEDQLYGEVLPLYQVVFSEGVSRLLEQDEDPEDSAI